MVRRYELMGEYIRNGKKYYELATFGTFNSYAIKIPASALRASMVSGNTVVRGLKLSADGRLIKDKSWDNWYTAFQDMCIEYIKAAFGDRCGEPEFGRRLSSQDIGTYSVRVPLKHAAETEEDDRKHEDCIIMQLNGGQSEWRFRTSWYRNNAMVRYLYSYIRADVPSRQSLTQIKRALDIIKRDMLDDIASGKSV